MRAQINLIFEDEELYNNLIAPLKASKRLRNLMLKLLTCYYYNPKVRDLVDNESQNGDVNVNELFSEARVTLLALSSLQDNLGMTLEQGIEKISSIASLDDRGNKSEFGSRIPNLQGINSIIAADKQEEERKDKESDRLDMLEKNMQLLMSKLDTVLPSVQSVSKEVVSAKTSVEPVAQVEPRVQHEESSSVFEESMDLPTNEHVSTEKEKNEGKNMLAGMLKAMG